jgi:uncharacterized protein (TIGR02647 family)
MSSYTPELVAELEILALFNLGNTMEGLKIHHTAAPTAIAAATRLHEKELITKPDGGYLTSLGHEAAEHAQSLLTILTVAEPA